MLARLANETGLQGDIDRAGQLLRVTGPLRPSSGSEVRQIVEQLGYFIEPLSDPPTVERWYPLDEVDELSAEEADILAKRWAAELEADDLVPKEPSIVEPLRASLERCFTQASATGIVGDIFLSPDDFGHVLSQQEVARVQKWILSKLQGLDNPAES